jgi:hypothetical protein
MGAFSMRSACRRLEDSHARLVAYQQARCEAGPATDELSPVHSVADKRRWRGVAATERYIGVINTHGDLLNRF